MKKIALVITTGLISFSASAKLFNKDKKDEAMQALEQGTISQNVIDKMKLGSSDDYYMNMDNGLSRPENQDQIHTLFQEFMPGIGKKDAVDAFVRGRNNWIVWTGGNDRFWDVLGTHTLGNLDFLKLISNDPNQSYNRNNRWEELGLVNEPCFDKNTKPRADRWGLMLDKRITSPECPPEPFSDEKKYPGIKLGARGTLLPYKGEEKLLEVGSFYGLPTGIVGLRLFTNPQFGAKAASKWDPVRYYNDPKYYNDPFLVRPYRVGMSCAFCHVGPNPIRQPSDFNNPKWENLSANVGAQYFWFDRVFNWNYRKSVDNFIYQLAHTARPGALDTSLVSSDQINNPRTMNAVYDLKARMHAAAKFGNWEKLHDSEQLNNQFSMMASIPKTSMLQSFTNKNNSEVISPRVLKDGADSVGVLGALNRVYVNIGLFSEHWLENFVPLVGGSKITPFQIKKAAKNSGYWQANVNQTPDLALFLLAASRKDGLADAQGGTKYLKDIENEVVQQGRKLFAHNCAGCHSSKVPDKVYSIFNKPDCVGAGYGKCWSNYVAYTKTSEYHTQIEKIVMQKDFLKDNFMSTDIRVPMTAIDTQLCSSIATNAIKDNIWDNFASSSYKDLPSIGNFTVNYPLTMKSGNNGIELASEQIMTPAGGRGYLRPPSLVSLWSTAPFFQNNTLGKFDYRGTVEGRMKSFDDSIRKLLNPDLRGESQRKGEVKVQYTTAYGDKTVGLMDVITSDSYLKIPIKFVPFLLKTALFKNIAANGGKFERVGDEYVVTYSAESLKKPLVASSEIFNRVDKRFVAQYESDLESAITKDENTGLILKIGPIPAGIPVNMISNLDLTHAALKLDVFTNPEVRQAQYRLIDAMTSLTRATFEIRHKKLTGDVARDRFMELAAKDLVAASKCSDMTVNRGHYFGTKYSASHKGLTADEQNALIEFLKHF